MPTIDFEARNAKSQSLDGVIRVPSDDGSGIIDILRDYPPSRQGNDIQC
jgi:hypothetical protein